GLSVLGVANVRTVRALASLYAVRAVRRVGGLVPAVHARASSSVTETDEGRDSARVTLKSADARLWSSRVTDPWTWSLTATVSPVPSVKSIKGATGAGSRIPRGTRCTVARPVCVHAKRCCACSRQDRKSTRLNSSPRFDLVCRLLL